MVGVVDGVGWRRTLMQMKDSIPASTAIEFCILSSPRGVEKMVVTSSCGTSTSPVMPCSGWVCTHSSFASDGSHECADGTRPLSPKSWNCKASASTRYTHSLEEATQGAGGALAFDPMIVAGEAEGGAGAYARPMGRDQGGSRARGGRGQGVRGGSDAVGWDRTGPDGTG